MSTHTPAQHITYEDSLSLPENKLEEIIRGELRSMPPPTDGHAALIEQLADVLRRQLDRKTFRVKTADFGLGITRRPYLHYRVPDLAVFRISELARGKAEKDERDPYIWVLPDLLVECLSPANRKGDVIELLDDYVKIGAPEVWFFYPERRELTQYRHRNGPQEVRIVKAGVSPLRMPSVSVELNELWEAFEAGF